MYDRRKFFKDVIAAMTMLALPSSKIVNQNQQIGVNASFWNKTRWHPFRKVYDTNKFIMGFHDLAYTISGYGRIPERYVDGNYIVIPIFNIDRPELQNKLFYSQWEVLLAAGCDNNMLMPYEPGYDLSEYINTQQKQMTSLGQPFTDVVVGTKVFEKKYGKRQNIMKWQTWTGPSLTIHKLDALNKWGHLWKFYHEKLSSISSNDNLVVFINDKPKGNYITVVESDLTTGVCEQLKIGIGVLNGNMVQVGVLNAV